MNIKIKDWKDQELTPFHLANGKLYRRYMLDGVQSYWDLATNSHDIMSGGCITPVSLGSLAVSIDIPTQKDREVGGSHPGIQVLRGFPAHSLVCALGTGELFIHPITNRLCCKIAYDTYLDVFSNSASVKISREMANDRVVPIDHSWVTVVQNGKEF